MEFQIIRGEQNNSSKIFDVNLSFEKFYNPITYNEFARRLAKEIEKYLDPNTTILVEYSQFSTQEDENNTYALSFWFEFSTNLTEEDFESQIKKILKEVEYIEYEYKEYTYDLYFITFRKSQQHIVEDFKKKTNIRAKEVYDEKDNVTFCIYTPTNKFKNELFNLLIQSFTYIHAR